MEHTPSTDPLPPKSVTREVRSIARVSAQQGILPSGPDQPLPVLAAFQRFLEQERRRTAQRVLRLIVVFSLILIGLATGGVFLVRGILKSTLNDIALIRNEIGGLKGQVSQGAGVGDEFKTLARNTTESIGQLTEQQRRASEQQKVVTSQLGDSVTGLRELLSTLSSETQTLKQELAALKKPRNFGPSPSDSPGTAIAVEVKVPGQDQTARLLIPVPE